MPDLRRDTLQATLGATRAPGDVFRIQTAIAGAVRTVRAVPRQCSRPA